MIFFLPAACGAEPPVAPQVHRDERVTGPQETHSVATVVKRSDRETDARQRQRPVGPIMPPIPEGYIAAQEALLFRPESYAVNINLGVDPMMLYGNATIIGPRTIKPESTVIVTIHFICRYDTGSLPETTTLSYRIDRVIEPHGIRTTGWKVWSIPLRRVLGRQFVPGDSVLVWRRIIKGSELLEGIPGADAMIFFRTIINGQHDGRSWSLNIRSSSPILPD